MYVRERGQQKSQDMSHVENIYTYIYLCLYIRISKRRNKNIGNTKTRLTKEKRNKNYQELIGLQFGEPFDSEYLELYGNYI